MLRKAFTVLLLMTAWSAAEAVGQSHFTACTGRTGNNATFLIPSSQSVTLNGNPLAASSELAVYTEDGLCAGVVVLTGEPTGFAIWGDDSQTPVKDGLVPGETLTYRVWDAKTETEYDGAVATTVVTFSDAQPFYSTENVYAEDGIYELSDFSMETGPVGAEDHDVPAAFQLFPNYPNPFNPSTTIRFELPEPAHVRITVFNVAGARVGEIMSEQVGPGIHAVRWDAATLPSGTYFCRLEAGSQTKMQTMVLLK